MDRSISLEKNYDRYFDILMQWEGGYANHPDDTETFYGITRKNYPEAFERARKAKDPLPIVKEFYYEEFWKYYAKYYVNYRHDPVIFKLMDISVNMGRKMAARIIQVACNIFGVQCTVDSIFGVRTAQATMLCFDRYGVSFINCINLLQGMRYLDLSLSSDRYLTFLRGWMRRLETHM